MIDGPKAIVFVRLEHRFMITAIKIPMIQLARIVYNNI